MPSQSLPERSWIRTGTLVAMSVGIAAGVCGSIDEPYSNGRTGATTTSWSNVFTPLPLNHETPSCTRSQRSVYVPGATGTWTFAWSVCAVPGATSVASEDRTPSQTAALPAESIQ